MIKVDLVYSGYLTVPNGAARLVTKLKESSAMFQEQGVDLRIISPDLYSEMPLSLGGADAPSLFKKIVRVVSRYSLALTYLRRFRSYTLPARNILDYYDKMQDKGDVLSFHESWTCFEYLTRHRNQGQIVTLTLHGDGEFFTAEYPTFPMLKSWVFKYYRNNFINTILQGCEKIGFDANLPRKHFCGLYPYDESKTYYVYNGIEKRPLPTQVKCDKLKLICVATLSDRKNQVAMFNAISMLPEEYQQQIEIVLVGDGQEREKLEAKAEKLKAKAQFTGTAIEKQYYDYLLHSNCFFLVSKSEGLPIAIIEGMRAGLPVIGSNIAGIPEQIVDGKTGFVVDLNEKKLAEIVKYLVDNLDVLPQMGEASYNLFLEKFTIEAMVINYSEVFKSK